MDEIDDDLSEPGFVAPNWRHTGRNVDHEAQALPFGEEPEALRGVRRDPAQIHIVEQHQRPAALDAGEVEELIDHLDEMPGLDLDLVDPVAHPRRHTVTGRLGVAGERLGQEAHCREWSPQLVRQVVDELRPDLL